jgi:hypothetical protein
MQHILIIELRDLSFELIDALFFLFDGEFECGDFIINIFGERLFIVFTGLYYLLVDENL